MIDFKTVKIGDKVKVVGMGAPGYAKLGDVLEIVEVSKNKVVTVKPGTDDDAFFALTCGASRLELILEKNHG